MQKVNKISDVAGRLTPQNVNTGKQIIQSHARELEGMLNPQTIKPGIEIIETKPKEKEADYGPEYQAMVKRVGQKAKAQELAKKKPAPPQPVRESRRALLKQIIQS